MYIWIARTYTEIKDRTGVSPPVYRENLKPCLFRIIYESIVLVLRTLFGNKSPKRSIFLKLKLHSYITNLALGCQSKMLSTHDFCLQFLHLGLGYPYYSDQN